MLNFLKKRNAVKISRHITAIDGFVVARQGQVINDKLVKILVQDGGKKARHERLIRESDIFVNLDVLLSTAKYLFISDYGKMKTSLVRLLGSIKLNDILLKELLWMKRYPYNYQHTLAVSALVGRMAMELFSDDEKVTEAAFCAMTHNLGITRVPDKILNKVSTLADWEMAVVREHPVYSYLLLKYYLGNSVSHNAQVSYEHHETMGKSGYPRNIVPQNIISRWVQICDVFIALITARPFRPALQPADALELMQSETEKGKLDPQSFSRLSSMIII